VDDWDKASSSHLSKLEACDFQLGESRDFPLSPAEEEILSRIRSDWGEMLKQAKQENNSTAAALKRLLALIGGEGADAP
jgi:outer membrane lipopolysaccharide assembly protein LptE/RlpB